MKIVEPKYEIITPISRNGEWEISVIERAARTCYKSEDKMTRDSGRKLVKKLIELGHEAMLEHSTLTVKFTMDRAMSHQLVRHRLASFAQESQRYCNYSREKFGGDIIFVRPAVIDESSGSYELWKTALAEAEKTYFELLKLGLLPEEARSVLPNATKTEIVVTANYREWRHILKLRTDPHAQIDIRNLMNGLKSELKFLLPEIFGDI